ncbi:MAG TPA: minor capsid protein [Spirillospora sp.]|nr:minor capsid protein [Spirillospora sp.]
MIAAAVAKYLAAAGLVTFDEAGADCFLEDLPPVPVDALAVHTEVRAAGLDSWGMAGVQLIARTDGTGGRARSGYQQLMDAKDVLHGLRHTTLDPGGPDEVRVVLAVAQTEEPTDLGPDDNDRLRWSLGFDLTVLLDDGQRFAN